MSDVFVSSILKQKAVYWAPKELDKNGNPVFDEPVEVKCRWTDMQRLYLKPNATQSVSRCIVLVDRDLLIGGMIWLGKLADVEDQDEPSENKGAYIIEAFNKVPDVSAHKFVREAIC